MTLGFWAMGQARTGQSEVLTGHPPSGPGPGPVAVGLTSAWSSAKIRRGAYPGQELPLYNRVESNHLTPAGPLDSPARANWSGACLTSVRVILGSTQKGQNDIEQL